MIKTIIAGPCSVESREQLRIVTEALAAMPRVGLIRAGVWKPRTRPGGFEGLGEPALQWMQAFAAEYGVRYCCEVATPDHVALCQRYGIGTVWIGARTTGNPFMVGELCAALRGSAMQVLVKNPTSPLTPSGSASILCRAVYCSPFSAMKRSIFPVTDDLMNES